jgi:hypothetical protein
VSPAGDADRVRLSLESERTGGESSHQQVLHLTTVHTEPESAAHDMIEQLRAVAAHQWPARYGWRPQHR